MWKGKGREGKGLGAILLIGYVIKSGIKSCRIICHKAPKKRRFTKDMGSKIWVTPLHYSMIRLIPFLIKGT
jgi:hypothetical protein